MLTAIFGLVGVIVGGLITALTTYWMEKWRVRREDRKEQKTRLAKLRQAARLLDDDFSGAMSVLQLAIQIKSWPGGVHEMLNLKSGESIELYWLPK